MFYDKSLNFNGNGNFNRNHFIGDINWSEKLNKLKRLIINKYDKDMIIRLVIKY